MLKSILFIFCLIVFVSAKATKTTKAAHGKTKNSEKVHKFTVIKVADGDTITVQNNTDKNMVRIRFVCIDAPEKSQPKWGADSLKKLGELLPLKTEVKLVGEKKDLYGRTVAEVINHKGVSINKKMTELGLVVMYPFQKGCDEYKELEAGAKSKKVGVWSDSKFELPWKYRERMGIGARGKGTSTLAKTDLSTSSSSSSSSTSTSTKKTNSKTTSKSK